MANTPPVLGSSNIILVGFMGTGKSATGRALAARLNREFLDMDTLIEQREQRSIPAIFADSGEPYFRALERALVQELSARNDLVIAPGGGIVLNPDNIRDFSRTGHVICLRATPEMILQRVGDDPNRPLLQTADKLGRIRELLAKRQHLYDAIPLQIETDGKTADEVALEILALLNPPR
ncbi:MAG: shikimate kinase [Kiritimatiellae bacterium]|nr:shikimate kinase [Kiritimatiellia bacterium]MCO5062294.1 shikimate kinase [Kiritimatiellia bacterium]MCO5067141.1 shikimate kinase [Kiritimatiellia bacterium]MCO6401559.1 shikimate kinase [Verrucomicrobiota bacterium]